MIGLELILDVLKVPRCQQGHVEKDNDVRHSEEERWKGFDDNELMLVPTQTQNGES